MNQQEMKSLIKRIIFRFSFILVFPGLVILISAGTFNYWQVYFYFAVLIPPMIFVLSYFLKKDPEFLERRIKFKEKAKQQKLVSILSYPSFLLLFIVPGLDHRFAWSSVPLEIIISADIIVLLGYLMIIAVFRQNRFASRIIEVDEYQKVISTGLYSIVRHPMYLGVLIMYLPTSLALGSYWGLIPSVLLLVTLVLRILTEEDVLIANLDGYREYCQKTRYRLIPYIW